MNLISRIEEIEHHALMIKDELVKRERAFTALVNKIVALHQKHRLANQYEQSDELRNMLNSAGIVVIQGTAGYEYDKIPAIMYNRTIDDTWKILDQKNAL